MNHSSLPRCQSLRLPVLLQIALLTAAGIRQATAQFVIKPTQVLATTEFTYGPMPAVRLIDGSGFSVGDAAAMTTGSAVPGVWPLHSSDRPNDGYSSGFTGYGNDGEMLPVLVFDLGAVYDISGLHLWNGNNNVGYWSAFEDVNVFKVSSMSLAVPGSGGTALSFNRVPVPNGPDAGETRSLSITGARYLLLQVTDAFKGPTDGNLAPVSPGYSEAVEIRFISTPTVVASKIYNLAHSIGGTAPDGVLAASPNQYWLANTLPAGLASGDSIAFSQNITAGAGTALIAAPSAITLGTITLANTIGDYTLKTDADVTTSGFIGTAINARALRKTGAASLIVTGPSNGNAGLIFDAGSIKLDSTTGGTLSGPISTTAGVLSTGGILVTGTGTNAAMIGGGATDTTNNIYVGTTTVGTALPASGNLIANKAAGSNAIAGDLVVQAGGTFRYSGNTVGNQIADAARITINGGAFGDITLAGVNPTDPGAAETVTDVTITANGNFSTGRAAFTATGAFRVLAGKALAHRAGSITANEVEVGATGSIDLDGGSTGVQSRLTVGAGGLTLTGGTINLNSHASNVAAGSVGSIVTLNGDVISAGTSSILDQKNAVMTAAVARIDLGGVDRAFAVTGQLSIGTNAAPIPLTNGGVVKNGTGNLTVTGSQTWNSLTINDGIVTLGETPPPPSPAFGDAFVEAGSAAAVPEPGALTLLALGALGALGRRRRA